MDKPATNRLRLRTLAIAAAFGLLAGCLKTDSRPAAATAASATTDEIWEAFFLQGAKIGYGQTRVSPIEKSGQKQIETDSRNHLSIARFGQTIEQELKLSTLEMPEGQLIEFKTEVTFGPTPVVSTGRVEGSRLVIETSSKGSRQTDSIAWSDDIRGFRGVEQSLTQQPLAPGEHRILKMLMPLINQVAELELQAKTEEATSVMGVEAKLLRIESLARLPDGNSLAETLWTNAQGEVIKRRIESMQQESFRTTRELAMAPASSAVTFDLGSDTLVKLDQPLARAHQTRQVRYRVELAGGDPAKTFPSGPTQSIRSLEPHVAELTVRSLRPGHAPPSDSPAEPPGPEYTSANNMLQVDDPSIQAMAQEARGQATEPSKVALALEHYVFDTVTKKDFSQAFATAAEVAQSRQGDCTEHAVLLAALARACKIPARVAIGLVYLERAQGFGFHMWTEVYLDGVWTPLDGTLGQGGIAAGHIKLTDSSLDGAAAYSTFLPVAQVLGLLKISVLDAE